MADCLDLGVTTYWPAKSHLGGTMGRKQSPRRAILCSVAVLASGVALVAGHSPCWSQSKNMNACVQILRHDDGALRNRWLGRCGEDQLNQEIESLDPVSDERAAFKNLFAFGHSVVIEESVTCGNAPGPTPVALGPKCGRGSRTLSENLNANAIVSIRLPDNKCARFIPLLLTNKNGAFACNAVQSRIACVDSSYDPATNRTTIKFSTQRAGTPDSSTIVIGPEDMAAHDGRIDDLIPHAQFAMLPATFVKDGRNVDVLATVNAAVEKERSQCTAVPGQTDSKCIKRTVTRSDALMQETLRHFRNPKRFVSGAERKKEAEKLIGFLKSKGVNRNLEQWILLLSIAQNEVGLDVTPSGANAYDPIYEMSDAVADNSGLSFGAHQIDIGANSGDDVSMFWRILDQYKAQHPDTLLDEAKAKSSCVQLPLRYMTVKAFQLTYRAAPSMSKATGSTDGVDSYNANLEKFLRNSTASVAGLDGFFKKSLMARVWYIDIANQTGSGNRVRDGIRAVIKPTDDTMSCSGVAAAEKKLLDWLTWNNVDRHDDGHKRFYKRYLNIRDVVHAHAPKDGHTNCSG